MRRPKIAFFDFACCEGCQLQIANMGESLLDILDIADIVEFREIMSEKWDRPLDVAVIEGSIIDPHAENRIRVIRNRAKILVAYGSCATIGGINGMKNNFDLNDIRQYVYGKDYQFFPADKTRAVHQVVKVDYFINGCPVYIPEFIKVLKLILLDMPYAVPDYAVCVECKFNENVCMYNKGITCMGPVTKAGCNSWCVNNGNICYGCRGMVTKPNENGAKDVLSKYNIPLSFIVNKMNMYNTCLPAGQSGKETDKSNERQKH